ncbi:MAG: FAD-dependent oxidoreductase [Phycisphaerae bacterium]|nr:FAD-dependent oxidoreductase [Phycisphaerae bacterium]
MSDPKTITIELNGIQTQVSAGTTLLQATQELDIAIPTLCFHKALTSCGACRVCLVEVTQGNRTELKTSCNNLAQDGMKVKTDTERVLKSRRMIVELLLSRSPDSEPILEIARQLGLSTSRFPKKAQDCILCGLCVRMCEERMGRSAISFAGRGMERRVIPPFDRQSDVCQTCGACVSVCPTHCITLDDVTANQPRRIMAEFDAGLCARSPIHIPSPQAVPKVAVIDDQRCVHLQNGTCGVCQEFCEPKAIDYDQQEEIFDLDVGAVILAPGFKEFAAERKGEYGFGRYPNVLTSVQFERMLSAAGPFEGHVIRPSDHQPARRIAWIQCVGSRDSSCGNDYCSSICCMASTKQAMVAQSHDDSLESTIFYMDIRAHGKDFDQYYERAKNQEGVQYIKSIPSRIVQLPGSQDLRLKYVGEDARIREEEYDLVVLSVGMEPQPSARACAEQLGIELNDYGFCHTDRFTPTMTSRPGVFVAGAFQEPKDIPETVIQASGAASMAMELLGSVRGTLITKKSYPEEHDSTDEEPRIGVFVCHCGINIASVVDVERVAQATATLPNVIFADHTMFTCSDTSLVDIRRVIKERRLNRVVVASCTPRTHEPLFRETLREAGLNPYLFELANIRDQCSWVHSGQPEAATAKAIELVKMSVGRTRLLSPLQGTTLPVHQTGLVIGGGLSGMTSALSLADQGFPTTLIEKSEALGGHLYDIHFTLEQDDMSEMRRKLIDRVTMHPKIDLRLDTEVTAVAGHIGHFTVSLNGPEGKGEVTCGAIVVATGANQAMTSEHLYGQNDRVLTQVELEEKLHHKAFTGVGKTIVMIQCVGSRNEQHAYCSRLCCSVAIKNALAIKKQDPNASIYVLYRDIRTYGFRELFYKQAREAGVVFIRYDKDKLPVVSDNRGLTVTLDSPDLPESLQIQTDHVILSTGIEPQPENKTLSDMLKVPLNADGFYVEAHVKLRPVDFTTEGMFLCGLAHSPKCLDENIAQAKAAAARAAIVLSKTHLDVSAQVSVVDQTKCISCMTCVHVCPYGAPYMNYDHKGQIEAAKCMGCGICASECPACAIQLNHGQNQQFTAMIDELFSSETRS